MLRMYGNIVEICKYKIINENFVNYAKTLQEAQKLAGTTGKIEELDVSAYDWLDGMKFNTRDEAIAVAEQGFENFFQKTKQDKINETKLLLRDYLEKHPLQWTDNEYYSITQDKQNQLTSTLLTAQADIDKPEWNTTGGICKEWEIKELTALGIAIKNRVKALVKYQQAKEIEIKNTETLEQLKSIIIDYDEVKQE